jgi:signal transduction histidine kinase
LGHDDVEGEAPGVLLNNWPLTRWHQSKLRAPVSGPRRAAMGDATQLQAMWRRTGLAPAVLVAGTASLLLPFVLQGAAIRAPTLRPALETMLTLFSLGAAWLLRAQFVASRRLRDLLLMCVTLSLGLTNLLTNDLPAALAIPHNAFLAGSDPCGQLFVAGIFAAAAAAPVDAMVSRAGHPARLSLLLGLAPLAAAALAGLLMAGVGINLSTHAGAADAARLGLVIGTTGLLVCGAIGFALETLRRSDQTNTLLAVAGLLLAGGVLSRLTIGPLPDGEVSTGTAMRVVGAALLLYAAVALERRVRARVAAAAALAERRRVACDLHDGIAQDLAFIAAHGSQIAAHMGDEHPVVVAARRALAVSRSTISDLSDPGGATAAEALDAVAQELRDRFHVAIAVHAQIDGHIPSGVREHLSRIAREAIANAARHGQARNVFVSLRRAEAGLALRVLDDGCGIRVGAEGTTPEGFGLRSISERAGALGGSLTIRPAPHGGTELEVLVP